MSYRTSSCILLVVAIALGVVLIGCSAPAPPPRELTSEEILDRTSSQMKTVDSVHFQMEITGGTMLLGPGIKISKLEGDAVRPDKLRVKTKATFAGIVVDVELVSAAGKQFLRNPLTQRWDALQVDLGTANLLDAEKGALTILRHADDLKRLPNEDLDGVAVLHIAGTVEASAITSVTGGVPSGSPVTIEAWIGADDFLLRKVLVSGSVVEGEPGEVARIIVFSQFNQPVKIELPQ